MNYCTYDQYAAAGGTLDEAAFAPLAARASRLIDRMAFGRAERHAAVCASCAAALADACTQRIYFTYNLSFGDTAYCRIATHLADFIHIHRDETGF